MSKENVLHNINKMVEGYDIDDRTRNEQIVAALYNLNKVLVSNGCDPIAGIRFTPDTLQQISSEFDAYRFLDSGTDTYAGTPLVR